MLRLRTWHDSNIRLISLRSRFVIIFQQKYSPRVASHAIIEGLMGTVDSNWKRSTDIQFHSKTMKPGIYDLESIFLFPLSQRNIGLIKQHY